MLPCRRARAGGLVHARRAWSFSHGCCLSYGLSHCIYPFVSLSTRVGPFVCLLVGFCRHVSCPFLEICLPRSRLPRFLRCHMAQLWLLSSGCEDRRACGRQAMPSPPSQSLAAAAARVRAAAAAAAQAAEAAAAAEEVAARQKAGAGGKPLLLLYLLSQPLRTS